MRVALPSLFAIPLFAACVAPTPGNVRQVPDPVSTRYINPGTLAALPGFTHAVRIGRSEEHTSELQSLAYLVCRLLLEKKKKTVMQNKKPTSETGLRK